MRNKIRLVCQDGHHNKYYEMEQITSDKMQVSYGRIGASPQIAVYLIGKWNTKYNEKIKKGYIDVSKSITKFSLEDVFANLDKLAKDYA